MQQQGGGGHREKVVFLSFTRDGVIGANFAAHVYEGLSEATRDSHPDVEIFMDHTIEGGEDYRNTIRRKSATCHVFVAIMSPTYLTRKWCLFELMTAFDNSRIIVPVAVKQQGNGIWDLSANGEIHQETRRALFADVYRENGRDLREQAIWEHVYHNIDRILDALERLQQIYYDTDNTNRTVLLEQKVIRRVLRELQLPPVQQPPSCGSLRFFIGASMCFAAIVAIGMLLYPYRSDLSTIFEAKPSSPTPKTPNSEAPTLPPNVISTRAVAIHDYINGITLSEEELRYRPPPTSATTEELALQWLIDDDPRNIPEHDLDGLAHRYAVATLRFSLSEVFIVYGLDSGYGRC